MPPAFSNLTTAAFDIRSASMLTLSLISPVPRIFNFCEFLFISFNFLSKTIFITSLVLIIFLTVVFYVVSLKKEWQIEKKLPRPFYVTLYNFVLFIIVVKTLDFFLAISILSLSVSYFWGEKRIFYLLLVSIIFPIIIFEIGLNPLLGNLLYKGI